MLNTAPAKPVLTAAGRFWAALRKPMISGLLVVIPAGITFFVLKLLYDFTAGRISPFIRSYIAPLPDYISPVVACVVLFVLVYGAGMVAGLVAGRKVIRLAEMVITRIPFVKSIYTASKQVVRAIAFQRKRGEPKTPVLVEFPTRGMKTIAFALGRVRFEDGREFVRVYIPTTPNISVGLLQMLSPDEVYYCGLSLDEAVKTVVSIGILGPEQMTLVKSSSVPAPPATGDADEDEDDWDEYEE